MATASVPIEVNAYAKNTTPTIIAPELAALQASDLFARFPPAMLRALAGRSALKQLGRGGVLGSTDTVPESAFLVVRGRIRAVRRGANGREITVESFRAGDLLADALAAPDQALVNDWEASEPTVVLVTPREVWFATPGAVAELGPALSRQLMRRLNRSHDLAVRLVLTDVQGRVVSTLLALARQDAEAPGQGALLIRQRPTQQELANLVGACRETVSRVVSDLTRRGLLQPQGRSLLIDRRLIEGNA